MTDFVLKNSDVPLIRLHDANRQDIRCDGEFVLYWMVANRRTHWNFSLQRALDWTMELRKPLVVLEALRCDCPWASDRIHEFVIRGMADNAESLGNTPVTYYP
jgi:deoxyribodipyrimidine photo-lyase